MSSLDPVLVRGLAAIEPYLDAVVVAGGWVPHIYEHMYDAATAGQAPRTRDIDLAIGRRVPVRGDAIDDLLTKADFNCEFRSLDTPPVTKYVAIDDAEVEIEFITDAPGQRQAVVSVQPGLTAQELRYVGLLLRDPWLVNLDDISDDGRGLHIRIPNPSMFVMQKALAFPRRRDRVKAEKDLYYIFFVFEAFPKWRPLFAQGFKAVAPDKRRWFKRAVDLLRVQFETPDSSGIDALGHQRPQTAFTGLGDDQFRQYAFSVMNDLIAMMEAALVRRPDRPSA